MKKRHLIFSLLFVLGGAAVARCDESTPKQVPPLKVLWVTGGGFHDYKHLTPLLTKKIQGYANATFDVTEDYKACAKKGFADNYDAVVYYFSYHDDTAKPVVENIAATVRAGKPSMFLHGTLHSFRELKKDRDSYCEAMGLTTVAHDKAKALETKKVGDHPISNFWPDDWKTGSDELYQNIKLSPNTVPLMTAYSDTSKKDHVVTWVNTYGGTRVFGTTLGHGKPTTDMPEYQHLLANGLLWICGKLEADGKPAPGYAGTAEAK